MTDIEEKLETQLMGILSEKFEKKQMKAEVEVFSEAKQARYFYAKLKEVRLAIEEAKRTNPIKGLRKKLSSQDEDEEESSDDDSDF